MTIQIIKTKAETAFAESFAQISDKLPGAGWVGQARIDAMASFTTLGLPGRRLETWKYTDLRVVLKDALPPALLDNQSAAGGRLGAALGALGDIDCIQIVFINGTFRRLETSPRLAPGGLYHFDTLAHALGTAAFEWIKPDYSLQSRDDRDSISALNTAFAIDGAVLDIAEGAVLAVPLHLVFLTDAAEPAAVFTQTHVKVGAGARAVIIESHIAIGDVARQSMPAMTMRVAEGAHVTHVKLLDEGTHAIHVGTCRTSIGANASYRSFQLTTGARMARHQQFVTFVGEGASADLSGVFLARGSGHVDTTLVVDHAVPHCASRELFKGVLDDRARGVFQGKLIVRPDAQKSDAKQMAKALLLSEDAEFDSKPELEIFADDVACGHGSTSGQIDADLLFYLQARGIPKGEARAMLIQSFIGEALDKIEHEALRDALMARAVDWLRQKEGQNQ